jgi:uncharacterized membrane protein YcaP (DUF421 family)
LPLIDLDYRIFYQTNLGVLMDPKMWSDMFQLGLPIIEKILRPLIVYFFLILVLRLAGKRELAQLNPFDLVVLLTLSNTVQNAIIGNDNSVSGGLIGAATLIIANFFVVRFVYNHRKIERIVEGDPDVLIKSGKVLRDRLEKEVITVAELEAAAHKQGFGSLDDVETATIEPEGAISFVGRKPDPTEERHGELMERLNQIAKELADLRAIQARGGSHE